MTVPLQAQHPAHSLLPFMAAAEVVMAVEELKDRTGNLFGRAADIERLLARARNTGLTMVIGPPMIGKSALLAEVARRLVTDSIHFALAILACRRARGIACCG
jgi:stage III sporulation protein SpoIIIAA